MKFSIITPIYKTPTQKLQRLYNSLLAQTYSNWEWIVYDDSPEEYKESYRFIDVLATLDSRIFLYTNNKNIGIIGEVKNNAFSLGKGDILVEVDHDDELVNTCLENLNIAYNYSNEIGFVYGNACEIYEDEKDILEYGDFFALGYGKYRTYTYKDKKYKVNITPNVNPKTIRHIVGIPNHVRSWRKDIYNKIGGHSKELHVADDYELFIRTFLNTTVAKIDTLTYIQYFERDLTNTQFIRNSDIQDIVHKTANLYNKDIHNRFIELNIDDYVWLNNNPPTGPNALCYDLNIENSKIEQYANIIIPNELLNNLIAEKNNIIEMENIHDKYGYARAYNIGSIMQYKPTEHYFNFIKWLVKLTNCQSYLEIGVEYGTIINQIKDLVKICVGVDLHNNIIFDDKIEFHKIKTDNFFINNNKTFDIILIDGNHNFNQLKKDFDNSIKILNKYGVIIIHDTDPIDESLLHKIFCDDAYKIVDYISSNDELNIITFPMQEAGMTLVMRKYDRRIFDFIESNEKYKIPHFYKDIGGFFDFNDIYTEMVNKFQDESLFVEIGSHFGKSASYMAVEIANSKKKIKFDCIDSWMADIWGIDGWKNKNTKDKNLNEIFYNNFLKNIESVKNYINSIRGWSYDVVNQYDNESIDFLFIDSCHEYESVKKEIEDWYPKVKLNGIIAGHDYTHNQPGVIKAVNEFFGENNIKKIIGVSGSGSWLVDKNEFENRKIDDDKKLNILIYHGYNSFNPTDFVSNGASGAEIAVTNLSEEFVKLGHNVFVVTQNSTTNCEYNGVIYLSLETIQNVLNNVEFDTIIVNRYAHFFNLFIYKTKKLYMWLHDLEILSALGDRWLSDDFVTKTINNYSNEISGFIVGSKWHKEHIINKYPISSNIPFNIISTGLNLSTFPESTKKHKHRFYWASRPERGLDRVLSLMPRIQEKLPDAELYVSTYVTSEEPEEYKYKVSLFDDLKEKIESVKGCYFLGSLPQDELHKQMLISDIWLYPTNFLETYCAVALEMMYSKVLCVATNLSGLKETIGNRGVLFDVDASDDQILDILFSSIEKSDEYKEKAYNWAKEQTWSSKALEWIKMIKSDTNG